MRNRLFFLFFLTLFVRVFLFTLPSFHIDMGDWEAWSYSLVTLGFSNFYSQNYFSDYFPGYLYILWIIGWIYNTVFHDLSFTARTFEYVIKFVTTLFDLGTAFFIYKIIDKFRPNFSKIAAILYLVNPGVIFDSSVWGQVDGIFTFFLVYSSYLLTIKRPSYSSFFSSISFIIKPHGLTLLPLFFVYAIKHFKHNLSKILSIGVLTFVVLLLPFFGTDFNRFFDFLSRSLNVYPYSSLFAFNFWGIFAWWKTDSATLILPYKIWGSILYLSFLFIIMIPLIKSRIKPTLFYTASSLSLFAFYLFMTRMHERYLFPAIPFLLIAGLISRSKFIFFSYLSVSLIFFINLWFVYFYYSYVFLNKPSVFYPFYSFVNQTHGIFSVFYLVVFIGILLKYYINIYEKKN